MLHCVGHGFFKALVKASFRESLSHGMCWFVFSDFLQLDLDKVKHEWNSHFIRQYRHCTVPGFPGELDYLPHTHRFDHCGLTLSADDVENVLDRRNIYSEAEIAKEINDEPFRPYFDHCSSSGHNCKDHL